MTLTPKQETIRRNIEAIANVVGIPSVWAVAVAMTESSLGLNQKSPTGCRGAFQMSSIAMKDLLQEMEKNDDDMIDILCGVAFLWLLFKRHGGSIREATLKYCDPADRDFYWEHVQKYMRVFGND